MELIRMIMPALVILTIASGVFWGLIRKLYKTLIRFVSLVLAMGGAFLLAKMFSGAVSGYVYQLLLTLNVDTLNEFLNNPEAAAIVEALCCVLAAPILFLVAYIILKLLSWIPYRILVSIFGAEKKRGDSRLLGAVAGALCGLVGLVVFVTPVFGYLHLADDTMHHFFADEEIPQTVSDVMDMKNSPVAAQAYDMVGQHLFTGLTTTTLDGEDFSLEAEIDALLVVVDDAMVLVEKSPQYYGAAEATVMENLAHDVAHSHILSTLLSSFLSEASNAWLNGKPAFGVEKPEMGADMGGIMDAFFRVFATSTPDNIEQDLTTFAEVFQIFIRNDMLTLLSGEGGAANFVEKLVSGGVVTDLYATLERNSRMHVVKDSIVDTGMRVMLEHLGVSDELQENHGELMEDIVSTLQNATKEDGALDKEVLNTELQEVLAEKEIEVSPEVTELVADGLADAFTAEELENLTMTELVDKLIDRFSNAELPEGVTLPNDWQSALPK